MGEYAGDVTPRQTWDLLVANPDAVLVDVRTEAEWRYVGVPDLSSLDRPLHLVEWGRYDFVDQLRTALRDRAPNARVLFICRSGQRSVGAAIAATEAGIAPAYNVTEGFEGPLDEFGHRGVTGWKAAGLPWRQS
jgi:rhodanese-related sulfurtransferase